MTTCTIIPFPLARRRAFIDRHARAISAMRIEAGERYLDRQLGIQIDSLKRRGFHTWIIEREVLALDAAIRNAVLRTNVSQGQR